MPCLLTFQDRDDGDDLKVQLELEAALSSSLRRSWAMTGCRLRVGALATCRPSSVNSPITHWQLELCSRIYSRSRGVASGVPDRSDFDNTRKALILPNQPPSAQARLRRVITGMIRVPQGDNTPQPSSKTTMYTTHWQNDGTWALSCRPSAEGLRLCFQVLRLTRPGHSDMTPEGLILSKPKTWATLSMYETIASHSRK